MIPNYFALFLCIVGKDKKGRAYTGTQAISVMGLIRNEVEKKKGNYDGTKRAYKRVKFTDEDIEEINRLYDKEFWSMFDIAQKYGRGSATIGNVIRHPRGRGGTKEKLRDLKKKEMEAWLGNEKCLKARQTK